MPASMRLPVPASAASTRSWMVCPAHALRLTEREDQTPATFAAVPPRAYTVCGTPLLPTTRTRNKSALVALFRWAKKNWNVSVMLPVGSAIGGEEMEVWPPSTSLVPTAEPAVSPVTKQLTDGPAQVPGCRVIPLDEVVCGSPRCH